MGQCVGYTRRPPSLTRWKRGVGTRMARMRAILHPPSSSNTPGTTTGASLSPYPPPFPVINELRGTTTSERRRRHPPACASALHPPPSSTNPGNNDGCRCHPPAPPPCAYPLPLPLFAPTPPLSSPTGTVGSDVAAGVVAVVGC
jgi:hypothetical protein